MSAAQTLAGSSDAMVRYGLAQALYHATIFIRVDEDEEKEAIRKFCLSVARSYLHSCGCGRTESVGPQDLLDRNAQLSSFL